MAFNFRNKRPITVYTAADFDRKSRFRTSREMFDELSATIGTGKPKSVDDLFGDRISEKDWWSQWYPLLELKDWADTNDGYNQLIPGHLSPLAKARAHVMAEDWSTMLLQLLNKARKKWGQSTFPSGQFIQAANDVDEVHYRHYMQSSLTHVSAFTPEGRQIHKPIVGWREEDLDFFYDQLKKGLNPAISDSVVLPSTKDKLMIISDSIVFIECQKRWQNKPTNSFVRFIPDLWYYRAVKCLTVLDESPRNIYFFINPEWSLESLYYNGFASPVTQ